MRVHMYMGDLYDAYDIIIYIILPRPEPNKRYLVRIAMLSLLLRIRTYFVSIAVVR